MSDPIPHAPKGLKCPLWKKDMSKVCHTCPLWVAVPTEDGPHWGCSLTLLPGIMLEAARQSRGAAAATEDARNKIVEQLERTSDAMGFIASEAHDMKLLSSR